MQVSQAVATRRSIRAFEDRPVDLAVLRRVLDRAQMAPSGCNFQPWQATVLAGEPLKRLQERMLASQPQDPIEYESTTHHTNLDTYERIIWDDARKAAVITASVAYHLATRDDLLPRFAAEAMPPAPAVRGRGPGQ